MANTALSAINAAADNLDADEFVSGVTRAFRRGGGRARLAQAQSNGNGTGG